MVSEVEPMAKDGKNGIQCPNCGCRDFRDEYGRPFKTTKTINIPGAIRRYKICRNCGKKVRTREIIEKEL